MECEFQSSTSGYFALINLYSSQFTFRGVACQLDALVGCFNVPSLHKALASLSKSLDETYARILSNVNEDHSQYVYRILQWLSFSPRPMHVEELTEVIAIDIEENPRFDPHRRAIDLQELFEPCSSLISISAMTVSDSAKLLVHEKCPGHYANADTSPQVRLAL